MVRFFLKAAANSLHASADEERAEQIKTELDESQSRRQILYGLKTGHHLGNAEENADSGHHQNYSPYSLEQDFLLGHNEHENIIFENII